MAKKFLVNIDLAKNQILNASIQNLASAPSSPVAGQIYFNTSDKNLYIWDSLAWVSLMGDIQEVVAGSGLTGGGTSGQVSLDINVDNATLEVTADTVSVKDLGITSAKINDGAVTTVKIAASSVTLSKLANIASYTVIGNTTGSSASPQEVVIATDLANASSVTLATSQAIKNYIDNNVGGLGNLEGGWDASSGSFPVGSTPTSGTKKGDYWYVTTAGTTGGKTFNVGDVIIATMDTPSTSSYSSGWISLEVNRDQATESILGVSKIATQSEVNAGTDDTSYVTPLKLVTYLTNAVGGYAQSIGDGSVTTYDVTHNLGTTDVIVMIKDNITKEEVITDVVIWDANTVRVSFATAPSTNSIRVIVKK